jgi:chromosome segregation ATPase
VEVDRASLYRLSQISRQIELMRERHRSLEAQAARISREALNVKDDIERLMEERDELAQRAMDLEAAG